MGSRARTRPHHFYLPRSHNWNLMWSRCWCPRPAHYFRVGSYFYFCVSYLDRRLDNGAECYFKCKWCFRIPETIPFHHSRDDFSTRRKASCLPRKDWLFWPDLRCWIVFCESSFPLVAAHLCIEPWNKTIACGRVYLSHSIATGCIRCCSLLLLCEGFHFQSVNQKRAHFDSPAQIICFQNCWSPAVIEIRACVGESCAPAESRSLDAALAHWNCRIESSAQFGTSKTKYLRWIRF